MTEKTVTATVFKSDCLKLIDAMNRDHEPVVVTRHGKPVARLVPVETNEGRQSLFGAMKDTIHYDDDLIEPAADPSEWEALR
ncbi:type II toxin-antitoxin system Phd/YefM family antitoxin [Aurantimonas sp. C2-6-R+9]|uniref:type II toxin-antitoxin system Phd/YefM family antitoxin n=1 Tax=unclassified Aurantimonas TaxID=2638230 RepID=UPI002E197F3A|nr:MULTISPECIES: type II toxin-antitoxin system Phd/YefM family antitoxin [unclassified Aurantimonas]MEC5291336.1 type II toxin-antitoxin system Phd/YefM family antitoxin [Aurantimonas sp. C2-3-R2]MEC5324329.1 type II toxin-antitoxin system Phd/YefM family antitoxin [Aurantimonas sp. A3-2-R12]MEC5381542.1 type II toxin-antitoxin system Phd/YefM family antitoxin [Aurantimonas sp. C2-6-R+9]MEC5412423.1 type II toxin-antitoxin system Phd/YefM family antitoxin [Aurantimonas sp. C2-4-R8]